MDTKTQKLHLKTIIGFGIGAVGFDLSYGLFNSFLMNYFTDVLYISGSFLAVMIALARVWDGINDPMMGALVDNTRSKHGKFRPWILAGTLSNAVVLIALFTNPGFDVSPAKTSVSLLVYVTVCYVLWDMSNTLADVPYWSMIPTFTNDPKERNIAAAIPRLFSGGGQLIIVVFTIMMVKKLGDGTEKNPLGFSRWAIICAGIMIVTSLVAVYSTRKMPRTYPNAPEEKITLKKAFDTIKSNDQLLVFMVVAILFNAGWYLTNALAIYFFGSVMENVDLYAKFGMAAGAGQALGLVLLPLLANKIGRNTAVKCVMGLSFAAYIAMFIAGQVFKNYYLFLAVGAVGCIGIGAMFVAQTAMLSDIVDYGEYKSGERTDAVVFSMKSFLQKVAFMLQALIMGFGLDLFKYDGSLTIQPDSAKLGISVMMFAIPALFVLCSFLVFRSKYKLDGERMEEVRKRVNGVLLDV